MEQFAAEIMQRSSDAIAIISVDDDVIVDLNEALFIVTGHSHDELVGSLSHELFVPIGPLSRVLVANRLHELGSVGGMPVGLRTRAGELRVGQLSGLIIDTDQGRNALCTICDLRDPTLEERRLAAHARLMRIAHSNIPWPELAKAALRAIGECLRWEFGALWLPDEDWSAVRRAAVWHSESSELTGLADPAQPIEARVGAELIRRVWEPAQTVWVRDLLEEADFADLRSLVQGPARGWFAFPVWEDTDVVGIVEFFSRQARQPNPELMQATDEFGRAFCRLLQRSTDGLVARNGGGHDGSALAALGEQPPPRVPSIDLREMVKAVEAVAEVIERQQAPLAQAQSPVLLHGLTASVGKLNRVLKDVVTSGQSEGTSPGPAAVPINRRLAGGDWDLRAALTLKAVSKRTGIPAATLRTWERRYRFTRPLRSATGYRLYSEEDVARILQVKYLLEQGVRVSEAIAALVEATGGGDAVPGELDSAGSV